MAMMNVDGEKLAQVHSYPVPQYGKPEGKQATEKASWWKK